MLPSSFHAQVRESQQKGVKHVRLAYRNVSPVYMHTWLHHPCHPLQRKMKRIWCVLHDGTHTHTFLPLQYYADVNVCLSSTLSHSRALGKAQWKMSSRMAGTTH